MHNGRNKLIFQKWLKTHNKTQVHSISNTVFQEYFKYMKNSSTIQGFQRIKYNNSLEREANR